MALAQPPAQGFDLILDPHGTNPLGLMLDRTPGRGAAYRVDASPGQETTEDPVYLNGGGGAGFTEQYVAGTYGWGEDVDTLTPGVILPAGERVEVPLTGATGYPADSFELGPDLYFVYGRHCGKIANGTSTTLTTVNDFGANIQAETAVIFNGVAVIGTYLATTTAPDYIWTTADGSTWTQSADTKRRHLAVVQWDPNGVPAHTLVGTPSTYQIQWCTAITAATIRANANWTSALTIGDPYYHIRKLVAAPRHIWAQKQEGVFDIAAPSNSAVQANLTPHWRNSYDIDNGRTGTILDGYLYAAHAYGIDRLALSGARQDIPERCEMGAHEPFSGPVYGRCVTMTSWRGFVIAAYYNRDRNLSYIMFGRPSERGDRPVAWHGAYSVVPGEVMHLKVHSPTSTPNVYLWIGTQNLAAGTYHLYRQYLAKSASAYQELLSGGTPRFQSTFSYYVPDGWDAPTSRRVPYRYDVHADRLSGSTGVAVYANFDRAASGSTTTWALQGTVFNSPRSSFVPASVDTSAYRVDYKLVGQGEVLAPPVLRAFQPRADVNREQDPVWTVRLNLSRGQALRSLGTAPDDPDITLDRLWTLQSESATPIAMISPTGNEATVQILPGLTVEEVENRDGTWDKLVTLRLRLLYGIWYWDSGVTYDSGRIWS